MFTSLPSQRYPFFLSFLFIFYFFSGHTGDATPALGSSEHIDWHRVSNYFCLFCYIICIVLIIQFAPLFCFLFVESCLSPCTCMLLWFSTLMIVFDDMDESSCTYFR